MQKYRSRFESIDKNNVSTSKLYKTYSALNSSISVVIIFSALYVEGEINAMGELVFGRKEFQEHYDSLRATDKILIIHKVVYGDDFDKSINQYRLLTELFKNRNDMAHPKSKVRNYSYIDEYDKAQNAIKVIDWIGEISGPIWEKYYKDY